MNGDVVIEAFTELAPRYEEIMDRELREFWGVGYEEFVNRLVEMVSIEDGDVVLDVATGTARIPLKIASEAGDQGRIVGLDITLPMLKYGQKDVEARGSSPRISLLCASAMIMPFVESVFDLVICGLGMHHMDVSRALSEMRRVLKDNDALFLAAVGARSFWKPLWVKIIVRIFAWLYFMRTNNITRAWAEADSLSNMHTASEWRAILSEFGFVNVEMTEIPARRFWYPPALIMKADKIPEEVKNDNSNRIVEARTQG